MERLTVKKDNEYFFDDRDNEFYLASNKLGHTEDIEEKHNISIEEMDAYITEHRKIEQEIGIELSVLFEALENGIWVKWYGCEPFYVKSIGLRPFFDLRSDRMHSSYKIEFAHREENGEIHRDSDGNLTLGTDEIELRLYGKTWALTKEELEQ